MDKLRGNYALGLSPKDDVRLEDSDTIEMGLNHFTKIFISSPASVTGDQGFWSDENIKTCLASKVKEIGAMPATGVFTAAEYSLASYDVKVIECDGLAPLLDWLNQNRFQTRPTFEKFLDFYVKKNWYFMVFNFWESDKKMETSTDLVSISFKTAAPFYPYMETNNHVSSNEPDSFNDKPMRALKLFF